MSWSGDDLAVVIMAQDWNYMPNGAPEDEDTDFCGRTAIVLSAC